MILHKYGELTEGFCRLDLTLLAPLVNWNRAVAPRVRAAPIPIAGSAFPKLMWPRAFTPLMMPGDKFSVPEPKLNAVLEAASRRSGLKVSSHTRVFSMLSSCKDG